MLCKKTTALALILICLTSCANKPSAEITDTQTVKVTETVESTSEATVFSESDSTLLTESTETEEEGIKWDAAYIKPKAIDKITDEIIRSDYAEYVSERDGREISADSVHGVFNFGTENKYRILVMCPSEAHTDDIRTLHLQCLPIPEDDCDCYPFIDVELPSGSYDALAYRHGRFYPIENAIADGLVSYDMAYIISDYMVDYYGGGKECIYTIK
ncbi:MAG: hypothetical protein IJZ72_02755 [Oscillospiraceae bacterium]|nr:hypothetical protein [Oscillospiraceae bacterium]